MLRSSRISKIAVVALTLGCTLLFDVPEAQADHSYLCVVTIYNRSSVRINYQLRAKRDGVWSDWKAHTHQHPNGGYHYHSYYDADKIEIRFDRIGGDDEFTEKTYNLDFYRVSAGTELCKHKGRPYKFQYDRGGRLLDLYTYHH